MRTTTIRRETTSKGRHPLLKLGTIAFDIYTLLRQQKALPYTSIASILQQKPQTINGQLQRMIGEGLVARSSQQKGNRAITVYMLADGNENGDMRDKIEIESTVYVNEYGEYSVKSRVVGELVTAHEDNPRLIHRVRHYAAIPRQNESFLTRQTPDPRALHAPASTKKPDNLVIDAEAVDTTDQ